MQIDRYGNITSEVVVYEGSPRYGPFQYEKPPYPPSIEGKVSKTKIKAAWVEYLREFLQPKPKADGQYEKAYFVTFTYRNIPKWGQDVNAPGMVRVARAITQFGESLAFFGGRGFVGEEFGSRAGRVHHHAIILSQWPLSNSDGIPKFGSMNPLQWDLLAWEKNNGFYDVAEIDPVKLEKDRKKIPVLLYCLKYTIKEEGRWWVFEGI